ncbi:MAG TPA: hypothetical protein VGP96_04520 [Candidatus Dormibacteraeota bacterium]|nr:hypothetical protein [Candidatus Dormibacteraeota bacterium]
MALTTTTAFAGTSHGSKSTKVSVKGSSNCTVVNNSGHVTCNINRSHKGGGNGDKFGRHRGGVVEGLGDIVFSVLSIL